MRAVVYGVGAMGSIMTRLLLDKGVEIVGAVARSPDKVGRDLGEVAGLGRETGIVVEADARRALEAGADVALVAAASYLSVMADHFRLCLEHGCNVLTIEEETVWPWGTAPELAAELDRVGKEHGATLAASGAQDVFWLNLVATLMGAAHRIDSVSGRCTWNADDYGPEVAAHVHLGESREAFERSRRRARLAGLRRAREPRGARRRRRADRGDGHLLRHAGHRRGGHVVREPRGDRPGGRGARRRRRRHDRDAGGPAFSFEMAGRVYAAGEVDTNEWVVLGEPELRLFNDAVPTRFITCTSMVNRIPDVIAAPPGLVTLDRLPRPRYRHGALTIEA